MEQIDHQSNYICRPPMNTNNIQWMKPEVIFSKTWQPLSIYNFQHLHLYTFKREGQLKCTFCTLLKMKISFDSLLRSYPFSQWYNLQLIGHQMAIENIHQSLSGWLLNTSKAWFAFVYPFNITYMRKINGSVITGSIGVAISRFNMAQISLILQNLKYDWDNNIVQRPRTGLPGSSIK